MASLEAVDRQSVIDAIERSANAKPRPSRNSLKPCLAWKGLPQASQPRDRSHAEEIFKALKAEGFQPVWIDMASTVE